MLLHGVTIEDTFAEAFRMWAARLIVTAIDDHWVAVAAGEACGYGTSVIGCDAEAGVERWLSPDETPDGRPGAALLFFAFNADGLRKAVPNRTGQCLMTCPTTAVYDGLPDVADSPESARLELGKRLRFFGDGFQKSKVVAIQETGDRGQGSGVRSQGAGVRGQESGVRGQESGGRSENAAPQTPDPGPRTQDGSRRLWRIPVMDGEFTVEDSVGAVKAIAGGNLLLCGPDQRTTLDAARAAVEAIAVLPDVITPFPGGIVRSGSKVGSRYKGMFASSNHEYCPTLRGAVDSKLRDGVGCVYEIVINGLAAAAIAAATAAGIEAACRHKLIAISAGNYGGKLGKFHFRLHEIMRGRGVAT